MVAWHHTTWVSIVHLQFCNNEKKRQHRKCAKAILSLDDTSWDLTQKKNLCVLSSVFSTEKIYWSWTSSLKLWTMRRLNRRRPMKLQGCWVRFPHWLSKQPATHFRSRCTSRPRLWTRKYVINVWCSLQKTSAIKAKTFYCDWSDRVISCAAVQLPSICVYLSSPRWHWRSDGAFYRSQCFNNTRNFWLPVWGNFSVFSINWNSIFLNKNIPELKLIQFLKPSP